MPDGTRQLIDTLRDLEVGGYRMGDAWHRAHELAQSREGESLFDRLHALCHRIEGDASNARYWYRRAGIAPVDGDFANEAHAIRTQAEEGH